jgi:hypothetical protein
MKARIKFSGAMKAKAETSASPHALHMNQTTQPHVGKKQLAKLERKKLP